MIDLINPTTTSPCGFSAIGATPDASRVRSKIQKVPPRVEYRRLLAGILGQETNHADYSQIELRILAGFPATGLSLMRKSGAYS